MPNLQKAPSPVIWILCLIHRGCDKGPEEKSRNLPQVTELVLIEPGPGLIGLTLETACFSISSDGRKIIQSSACWPSLRFVLTVQPWSHDLDPDREGTVSKT